jgi:hypothetical protein
MHAFPKWAQEVASSSSSKRGGRIKSKRKLQKKKRIRPQNFKRMNEGLRDDPKRK